MPEPADNAPETEIRKSRGLGNYTLWGFVMVMLYVLSFGPVMRFASSNPTRYFDFTPIFYRLLGFTYVHTPLHKAIGWYMHLWCPGRFDSNGEIIPPPIDQGVSH